ncbi:ABC transporter ATP-binding protein [Kineothrix sp. MSJ-39]|uniref:ABC transporter ATP-binding protein n=1 Tax=Kineothrix sp. MSJ-39 TaxID=2841533 RepID=UPI001C127A5E|nr:ABC transporter ATP-binding protein [Kineothrix sp. MSJ-39]MBU5430165.1 ABC transporter ATP-binding protein [Kineothrix sp. MSJ-39]
MSGLQTDNLTVGYGSPLVKEISLRVRPGRVLTLIGPNGCGKSTILKSVTRQLKTLGGSIFLGGQAMETMKEAEIARKLAMVMTEHIRPELMTCRDIVATGRYPYTGRLGILTEADWQKVEEAIAFVHAEDVAAQDFNKVSDGQRQRIMLARAICQETEILVLDEPTSYLDIRYKLDILSGIRRLAREKNVAVIMSLHELDLAQQVSDLIACVEDGGIVIDTPEKIFSGNRVQKLYGVADAAFDPLLGVPCMLDAEDRKQTDAEKDTKGGSAPEVFVISGGGTGISVYRKLQREGISFAAGILSENDLEYRIAEALAVKVVAQKAFYPISEQQLTEAKKWIDACAGCICLLDTFGPLNEACRELQSYAEQCGKLRQVEEVVIEG